MNPKNVKNCFKIVEMFTKRNKNLENVDVFIWRGSSP